jgi:predicted esterase
MHTYHWMDLEQAARDIAQHLAELASAYPLHPARRALGGFSNGGRAALALGLSGVMPATDLISVGSPLPDETLDVLDWDAVRAAAPRVLFVVGERDARPLERIQAQAAQLTAHGLSVDLHIIPDLGHRYPSDFAERLAAWLA